jgi:hypothetical protein
VAAVIRREAEALPEEGDEGDDDDNPAHWALAGDEPGEDEA